MVHVMTPYSQQLPCHSYRNLVGLLNLRKSWQTWPFVINWSLGKILLWQPWKLHIPKLSLTNSGFCRLLTWSQLMHGSTVLSFQRRSRCWTFLDGLDIEVKSQVWGPKIGETWWGLITDSAAHLLNFSMPTHTHNFGNHRNGYGCSKTALVRSWRIAENGFDNRFWNPETVSELGEDYDF
jgi:hypothetical protein